MIFLAEPVGPELIVGFGLILASLVLTTGIRLPVGMLRVLVGRAAGGTPVRAVASA